VQWIRSKVLVREVLGLNLGCGKVANFVGKTLKKSGEELAGWQPSPQKVFFLFFGVLFIFVFAKC
jgi:hypothetical protein